MSSVICPEKLSIMTRAVLSPPPAALTHFTQGMMTCSINWRIVSSLDQCLGACVMSQSLGNENFGWQQTVFPLYINWIGRKLSSIAQRKTAVNLPLVIFTNNLHTLWSMILHSPQCRRNNFDGCLVTVQDQFSWNFLRFDNHPHFFKKTLFEHFSLVYREWAQARVSVTGPTYTLLKESGWRREGYT